MWCLIACCLSQIKETGSKSGEGHPTVNSPTLVPNHSRDAGGLSQASSNSKRSHDISIRARLHNESGVGGMVIMTIFS